MHIVYEGKAIYFEGSPVYSRKPNKPHIAKLYGKWWHSINGYFNDRKAAKEFCDELNKEIK